MYHFATRAHCSLKIDIVWFGRKSFSHCHCLRFSFTSRTSKTSRVDWFISFCDSHRTNALVSVEIPFFGEIEYVSNIHHSLTVSNRFVWSSSAQKAIEKRDFCSLETESNAKNWMDGHDACNLLSYWIQKHTQNAIIHMNWTHLRLHPHCGWLVWRVTVYRDQAIPKRVGRRFDENSHNKSAQWHGPMSGGKGAVMCTYRLLSEFLCD